MKNMILRASAVALALAAGAAVGCSSGGCGGTNINSDSGGSNPTSMACGNGTYLNAQHQCVPLPSNNNTQAAQTNYISN
ncbi:MAG: hypothetical protein HY079_07910 [Elusimicrobia bacterium]|nr:hypothetical protein [Elusimicrobiota bacterium]